MAVVITGVDIATVPENGGVKVTVTGTGFLEDDAMLVNISDGASIDRKCYSGVVGQGYNIFSVGTTSISFITPPLPIAAGYDIVIDPTTGPTVTESAALESIHRTFATPLFGLRSNAARPRYVGPYSIDDED